MSVDPHPASEEIAYAGVADLRRRLDAGELSSRELVDTLLERVAAVDRDGPRVNSLAAVAEDVREMAAQRDDERAAGERRGALHGIPIIVKDNVEARGLPALAGSTALVGRGVRDAALVTRLRSAGALIMASSNLSEWANIRSPHSTSGYSATGGLVANPWALDRSAGGSSSGSGAALAAGLAPLAVGTETDGSITCPASLNGVYGLKPTVGRVSRDGVVPISRYQDSPGPMARSVDDLTLLLDVMSETPLEPAEPLRFVVANNWRTGHGATDALFKELVARCRAAGLDVVEREAALPSPQDHDDELLVLLGDLHDSLNDYLAARPGPGVRSLSDVVDYEEAHAAEELRYFGHEFFVQALATGGLSSEAVRAARARNLHWAVDQALTPLLASRNVVLSPAYGPAWKSDLTNGDNVHFASPAITAAAIAGWPIATMPMGLVDGLPVGVSLVGRASSEATVLAAMGRLDELIARDRGPRAPAWSVPTRG
jgi:amidase